VRRSAACRKGRIVQPDTGWSTGQRALLRFLEQQGILPSEPAAPATGRPSNSDLFATFADAIDQQALVDLVSHALRIAAVDLAEFVPMSDLAALVPSEVAQRAEMVPIAQYDGTLEVAAANPLDLEAVKSVEFTSGLRVRTKVARRADVCRVVSDTYGVAPVAETPAPVETVTPTETAPEPGPAPEAVAVPPPVNETPVPELVAPAPAAEPPPAGQPGAWSFEVQPADAEVAETASEVGAAGADADPSEADEANSEDDVTTWTLDIDPDADDEPTAWMLEIGDDDAPAGTGSEPEAADDAAETSADPAPAPPLAGPPEPGLSDLETLGGFDDVRLDDGGETAAQEETADETCPAAPSVVPGASLESGRPAVLVVSRDLSRRVVLREALEQGADAPCVLTMRDEVEARATVGLGRVAVVVVEGGALAADGRPLWEVLRARVAGVVVWGGRPLASGVVGLDRDTNVTEVAARVRALLEETVDD
jgi:hypothetical protein